MQGFIFFWSLVFCALLLNIFCILWNHKNMLILLIYAEGVYLALTFCFTVIAYYTGDDLGYVIAVYIITLAGCESCLGFSLLVKNCRVIGMLDLTNYTYIKV